MWLSACGKRIYVFFLSKFVITLPYLAYYIMKAYSFYVFFMLCTCLVFGQEPTQKHRLIVLSDIENEPDDCESMVRLMLYSNSIDIEGLIATTSVHMQNRTAPETIQRVVKAYGQVRDNLLLHESGFPQEQTLLSLIKSGQPGYGVAAIGKDKDSEGSRLIEKALRNDDSRPLWVTAWGGVNTLAQALFSLKASTSAKELKALVAKLRVYTISDQDDSGIWIRKNFPDLFYIVSPGGYGNATWSGIMEVADLADNERISNKWLADNIQQGHGPLGACYPDVAYGMEGDTPSFLNLIPNGLHNPEEPSWGGWGGRYEYYIPKYEDLDLKGFNGGVPIEEEPHPIWTNAIDTYSPYLNNPYGVAIARSRESVTGYKVTQWRWRTEMQNDFAARMDWCVKTYEEANHAPVALLTHSDRMTVKGGSMFILDATPSTDPDGDNLSFLWFNYPEAGSYKQPVRILGSPNIYHVNVIAPIVDNEETIHFILRVTDKGNPSISRYRRIIVTVVP